MPLSKIKLPSKLDAGLRHEIAEHLHASLVNTCDVAPDDNFCLITRHDDDKRIIHPSLLGRSDPMKTIVMEIMLLAGRTDGQKEELYRDIRRRLEGIGIRAGNVFVYLVENSSTNWSFGLEGFVKKMKDP